MIYGELQGLCFSIDVLHLEHHFLFFVFWFGMCVLSISNLPSVGNSSVEYTPYVSPIATCSKEKENIDE
jgi:hypothetical protein